MRKPLQIEILERSSYLHVVHEGIIDDMQLALRCFKNSLDEARLRKKYKILADLTHIEQSPLSATDRILYFQSALEIYHSSRRHDGIEIRLAILQPPEARNNYTPGIDVAKDDGMSCEIFYNELLALQWLELDSQQINTS